MRIPEDEGREDFLNDVIQKCMASQETRIGQYNNCRNFFLFGYGDNDPPAHFNKIYPHIDQLISFLYSAETTRFTINLGAAVNPKEHVKTPVLTAALNDAWHDSNGDQVFRTAIQSALQNNSSFIKLIYRNGIQPYMVDAGCIGVLREDSIYTDRQEAIVHEYYITKSELFERLYLHKNRDKLIARVQSTINEPPDNKSDGLARVILAASSPNMQGNIDMNPDSTINQYRPVVAEETIRMRELWIWDTDAGEYAVITVADPDVIIYDRLGSEFFIKGETPFIQVCPDPLPTYYWGLSEVQKLIWLQRMRNKRINQIMDLLDKQVKPPKSFSGFMGISDEKAMAFDMASGFVVSDNPSAQVKVMSPELPQDLFKELSEIDAMFAEASGISSILSGKGESGVRSQGHASQLARLGASRIKQRALIIEDALEKVATLYLKLLQRHDNTHYTDTDGNKFIAEQFTPDFIVKVDAHSNSPIFMEDSRDLAFNLFKAGVITPERLIDLSDAPMKQQLKEDLKAIEAKKAAAAQAEQQQKPEEAK